MTERARYWNRLLTEWERSGLSQAEFARRRGVQAVTFSWWKRQLRGAKGPVRRGVPDRAGDSQPRGRADFVEVVWPRGARADHSGSTAALSAEPGGYEVVLANGRVIRLPRAFDAARVVQLIAAVESC